MIAQIQVCDTGSAGCLIQAAICGTRSPTAANIKSGRSLFPAADSRAGDAPAITYPVPKGILFTINCMVPGVSDETPQFLVVAVTGVSGSLGGFCVAVIPPAATRPIAQGALSGAFGPAGPPATPLGGGGA